MAKRSFDDIFGAKGTESQALFQPTALAQTVQAAAVAGPRPAAATPYPAAKKHKKSHGGSQLPSQSASQEVEGPTGTVEKAVPQISTAVATLGPQKKTKGNFKPIPAAVSPVADARTASSGVKTVAEATAKASQPQQSPAAAKLTKSRQGKQAPKSSHPRSEEAQPAAEQDSQTTAAVADPAEEKLSPAQREERLDRTIFVGNIQADTKPKVLKNLFSRYGKVDSVRLRSIPVKLDVAMPRRAAVLTGKVDASRATAHAYIVFSTPEEAKAALGQNMQVLGGLHMRVDSATGPGSGTASAGSYNKSRSIFVGNLHFAAQDEDLVRLFSDGALDPQLQGAVTAVRVVRDSKTNIGKGIAFVEFKDKGAAAAAMRLKDVKLDGRPLRISFLKTPKPGSAAPAAPSTFKVPGKDGAALAKERIQKKQQAAAKEEGKKKPSWAGARAKKTVPLKKVVPTKKAAPGAKKTAPGKKGAKRVQAKPNAKRAGKT